MAVLLLYERDMFVLSKVTWLYSCGTSVIDGESAIIRLRIGTEDLSWIVSLTKQGECQQPEMCYNPKRTIMT